MPGLTNILFTEDDTLLLVARDAYYGHPNPLRGEFVLNGGNPTSGADYEEFTQYPVGTQPDSNYKGFAYDFGENQSPNGVVEFKSGGTAFVVGDLAALQLPDGSWLPGVSPAAMQGGRHAATTVVWDIRRQERHPFRYHDKGIMATIGKSRAVGVLGPLRLTGHLAWFAWLFVHVYYLIGFKNRLAVMWQWAWSYLFSKRGARLIVEKEWRLR